MTQSANKMAFKEWAAICAALGEGLQSLIMRKGGIHEGREGFRVAHHEFWLFPTYLHEQSAGLVDEAQPLLERAIAGQPHDNTLRIADYAVVADVHEVHDSRLLTKLTGLHVWSHRTIDERFNYRQPGLFVLTVRMSRRATPFVIPDSPHFGGCRSWVELPEELSTADLQPVLSDEEFARERGRISAALRETT